MITEMIQCHDYNYYNFMLTIDVTNPQLTIRNVWMKLFKNSKKFLKLDTNCKVKFLAYYNNDKCITYLI
jgi:hypothetical protein